MKIKKMILMVLGLSLLLSANAIEFTADELDAGNRLSVEIAQGAAECLNQVWTDHVDFFAEYGFSRYYGCRNRSCRTRGQRLSYAMKGLTSKAELCGDPLSKEQQQLIRQQANELCDDLEQTYCVGLAFQCLGKGFLGVEDSDINSAWGKISSALIRSDFKGTVLIESLRQFGWTVLYWNVDPERAGEWDRHERKIDAKTAKGYHRLTYQNVTQKGYYYKNPDGSDTTYVDNTEYLVGFKTCPPPSFNQFEYFIGLGHLGYHVFSGSRGIVTESHSGQNMSQFTNIERNPFNPAPPKNQGPMHGRTVWYYSGIIAVPPTPSILSALERFDGHSECVEETETCEEEN